MANKDDKDKLQVPDNVQLAPPHEPETEIQPAPVLSKPSELPEQPAPAITTTEPAATQPSQDVSLSVPPAEPQVTFSPQPTKEAPPQPSQDPGTPAPVWEPVPVAVSPSKPPAGPVDVGFKPQEPADLPPPPDFQPAPNAVLPQPPEFTPAPNATLPQPPDFTPGKAADLPPPPAFSPQAPSTLPPPPEVQIVETQPAKLQDVPIVPSVPATLPQPPDFQPQPNSTLPDSPAFNPAPNAVLPPMPAPPPSVPAVLPPMPAPPPSPNAVLPPPPDFNPNPNAVLPPPPAFNPNPNATLPPPPDFNPNQNAVLPPPPAFNPTPNATLPDPPDFKPQPNAVLPPGPPFNPQPNAVLPPPPAFAQPPEHAPNGQLPGSHDPLGKLTLVDEAVKKSLQLLVPFGENGGGAPGSHALDPLLYAKNLQRLALQVGPFGLTQFSALQYTLMAMNVNGKVWNPATIAPPPGTTGWAPIGIDDFVTHEDLVDQGASTGDAVAALEQAATATEQALANPYTPDNPYTQDNAGTFFSIGGMVDQLTGKGFDAPSAQILTDSDLDTPDTDPSAPPGLAVIQKVSIASLYSDRLISVTPNGARFQAPTNARVATAQALPGSGDKLARAYYSSGIVPAGFDNEQNGFIKTVIRRDDPSTLIDDDEAYVPLSFMDLRPMNGSNEVRTVYFRPFLTNLTEDLSPEWNKQNFFGRTDAIATYMATSRVINLGFSVHAFAPEDLELIYQKKNWLASMCYPSYDKDMLFKAGPIIRLRVGDLLKTGGGFGLPGIIESISFDYNDVVWELQKGNKVPMGFKVSMSFLVLHEKPVGLGVEGQFGGIGRIDPGTGKWSPPTTNQSSTDQGGTTTQNAPEMDGDAIDTFSGGTGNKLNSYAKK